MIANTPSAKEKVKALDLALAQIEKQFGKGAIMKLGEESAQVAVEIIPSGSIALDMALGIGGVPRGRVVEIYGPESSGKTTLALTIIANAQKQGGNAVFIDAEHALDAAYAQKLGVDIANLHVAQPDTGEEALEIADHLVRSGAVDVVVIDSVAALVPRAEIEGEMGDSHVGLQARLMSQALRKLTGSISKSRTTVIFINQIRMQIGVMFGSPETTAGGRALKFYASVRMDIRRIATLKEGDQAVGNRTKVKVVKNKVAAPFREAEFDIIYNEGISREGELIDFALEKGVIQRSGTWFSFGEERIGQGRENARLFLKEHRDIRAQVEAKLLPLLGLKVPVATSGAGAAGGETPGAKPPTGPAPAKPAPGVASARPQPAMVASGDRKR
jgi:recombination protein RecA